MISGHEAPDPDGRARILALSEGNRRCSTQNKWHEIPPGRRYSGEQTDAVTPWSRRRHPVRHRRIRRFRKASRRGINACAGDLSAKPLDLYFAVSGNLHVSLPDLSRSIKRASRHGGELNNKLRDRGCCATRRCWRKTGPGVLNHAEEDRRISAAIPDQPHPDRPPDRPRPTEGIRHDRPPAPLTVAVIRPGCVEPAMAAISVNTVFDAVCHSSPGWPR